MAQRTNLKMIEVTNALWQIEEWVRSVREVLLQLPGDSTVPLAGETLGTSADDGGSIKVIRGCPPPEEECEDDDKKDKDKDKDKDKNKIK